MIEITESDLREVAEKLGWEFEPPGEYNGARAMHPDDMPTILDATRPEDSFNAIAILAIERILLEKGVYSRFDLLGDVTNQPWVYEHELLVWSVLGSYDYDIVISPKQLAAPNFRSWLIVQIVKRLPQSVFEVVE